MTNFEKWKNGLTAKSLASSFDAARGNEDGECIACPACEFCESYEDTDNEADCLDVIMAWANSEAEEVEEQ